MPLLGLFWLLKKVAANKPSLRKIDLRGKLIGEKGARRLARALRGNTVVNVLLLQNNRIGDEGMVALADMLKHNCTITELHLNCNSIGDAGARALADMLRGNSCVITLDLSSNDIGPEGIVALAESFRDNTSISKITLSGNRIGEEGARALAGALRANSSITDIDMFDAGIGNEGALALAEALREGNSSVAALYLAHNDVHADAARAFADALLVNSSIVSIMLHSPRSEEDISRELGQYVDDLAEINAEATSPEEARGLKLARKVGWLLDSEDNAEEEAVSLSLDVLNRLLPGDQRRTALLEKLMLSPERGADIAKSVDTATAGTMYRYAADCRAAPGVVMNLMRAHPSLCTCRDARHGLFPFMLLATMAEAGAGDMMELLLLNPNLVESGIGGPVEHVI